MALRKEEKFMDLFQKLSELEKNSTLDFMEYLIQKKKQKDIEKFYSELPEVDEPFSKEEIKQMKEAEFISLDDAYQELNLNDGSSSKSKCN